MNSKEIKIKTHITKDELNSIDKKVMKSIPEKIIKDLITGVLYMAEIELKLPELKNTKEKKFYLTT